jgi:hypothetical protein
MTDAEKQAGMQQQYVTEAAEQIDPFTGQSMLLTPNTGGNIGGGNVARFLTASVAKGIGEQLGYIATATGNRGLESIAANLQAYGRGATSASVRMGQNDIVTSIANADGFGKVLAGLSAALRNPAATLDWGLSEGVQEFVPLLAGVGVGRAVTGATKLAFGKKIADKYGIAAAVGTNATLDAGESAIATYQNVRESLINRGFSEERASRIALPAAFASGLITLVTTALGESELVAAATRGVPGSVVRSFVREAPSEFAEGFGQGVVEAVAITNTLPTLDQALTQGTIEALVGGTTTGLITAGQNVTAGGGGAEVIETSTGTGTGAGADTSTGTGTGTGAADTTLNQTDAVVIASNNDQVLVVDNSGNTTIVDNGTGRTIDAGTTVTVDNTTQTVVDTTTGTGGTGAVDDIEAVTVAGDGATDAVDTTGADSAGADTGGGTEAVTDTGGGTVTDTTDVDAAVLAQVAAENAVREAAAKEGITLPTDWFQLDGAAKAKWLSDNKVSSQAIINVAGQDGLAALKSAGYVDTTVSGADTEADVVVDTAADTTVDTTVDTAADTTVDTAADTTADTTVNQGVVVATNNNNNTALVVDTSGNTQIVSTNGQVDVGTTVNLTTDTTTGTVVATDVNAAVDTATGTDATVDTTVDTTGGTDTTTDQVVDTTDVEIRLAGQIRLLIQPQIQTQQLVTPQTRL